MTHWPTSVRRVAGKTMHRRFAEKPARIGNRAVPARA